MNKTAIIIQARTGSTRLPNKMILPFYNNLGVLEIVLKRINKEYKDKYLIILATTTNKSDDVLVEIAIRNKVSVYRGEENNVLSRFIDSSIENEIDNIIRVCADNPFLNVEHIQELIEVGVSTNSDYVSYRFKDNIPVIKSHLGIFTEFTKLETLKEVNSLTSDSFFQEHVTNYIYSNPDTFKIDLIDLKGELKGRTDLRFTLDTKEDFSNLQNIYSQLGGNNNLSELISIVDKSDEYKSIMKKQIIENSK